MKTAVEWLLFEIKGTKWKNANWENKKLIIDQAKEMEKQQIIDAAYFGHLKGWVDDGFENSYGEQYYNETFKK